MDYDLKRVMDEYGDAVYRCAFMYCGNEPDAEDITQDVFCKYLEKHPVFQDERHEKAWLLRVAINLSKNHVRSYWNQHTQGLDESIPVESAVYEGIAKAEQPEDSDIAEYIEKLPKKYRLVIQLYYLEEYSTQEIAGILKRRPSTIRTWLARARAELKKKMEE